MTSRPRATKRASSAGDSKSVADAAKKRDPSRPRGRQAVTEAILDATLALIAERGPASVSLRDIAQEARVNLGLVYKYLGTKDELIAEVTRRSAANAAERLASAAHFGDALAEMTTGDGRVGRVLAWAALEGRLLTEPEDSLPAMAILADLYRRDAKAAGIDASEEDGRLAAAIATTTLFGWRVLGPFALASAGLDPNDREHYNDRFRELARSFGNRLAGRDEGRPEG